MTDETTASADVRINHAVALERLNALEVTTAALQAEAGRMRLELDAARQAHDQAARIAAARLRALLKYGDHTRDCPVRRSLVHGDAECECGFRELTMKPLEGMP